MEQDDDVKIKRKGSMLEELVAMIFRAAGFEVTKNKYFGGFEVDNYVSFGDRNIIIECKQYEKTYLPVKSLILEWKGKNEIIKADGVLFVIYGVNVTEEEQNLARQCGIRIWGIDEMEDFLPLLNDREKLLHELLNRLDIKERDIAETNEVLLKDVICKAILTGQKNIPEEVIYKIFRRALRYRIITNLKQYGSTASLREKHIQFFENVVKETKTRKVFIFKFTAKMSQKEIWADTYNKLKSLKPFDEAINSRYIHYMQRLEEGFKQYLKWFNSDPDDRHRKLLYVRLYNRLAEKVSEFYLSDNPENSLKVKALDIILDVNKVADLNILEWILTDMAHETKVFFDEKGNIIRKEIHWHHSNFNELLENALRVLYEYFGANPASVILDSSLSYDDLVQI